MTHGRHIYSTSAYMDMAIMCAYPPSQHILPHLKCVLRCCSNCPRIYIPHQESGRNYFNAYPSIRFHIYHLIAQCTFHGRLPLDEKNFFPCVFQYPCTVTPAKLYTRKELIMMETSNADFHTSFIFQKYKISHFAFHTYIFQVLITLVTHAVKHYNVAAQSKICCDVVIMLRYWWLVLHTKYILNTMAEIYLCVFKALSWSALVHQHMQKHQEHDKHAHVMLCSIYFF